MNLGRKVSAWQLTSFVFALILLAPILVMFVASLGSSGSLFSHLWQTVLPTYISNTLQITLYVVVLSLVFGIPSAALITQTNVWGNKYLRWLLLLPLAMPAYVVAYLYTDLFDYAGPIQRALRALFGWTSPADYYFFDIRTIGGAAVILALVLYPYVYMLTRTAFEQQDRSLLRAGRTLGLSAKQVFFKVALPIARPAIMVSATLVMMETIADFATVQYFAVNTLTTAIYDTWLGYGDMAAANLLASVLMMFVLIVVVLEQKSRAMQKHQTNRPNPHSERIVLTNIQQLAATSFCWFLVVAGFLLPFGLLLNMVFEYASTEQSQKLFSIGVNTLEVSIYAATISVVLALVFCLCYRISKTRVSAFSMQMSGFGYAVPGTVLAMALMATFAPIDHGINKLMVELGFNRPGLILSGTSFAIVFAFVVRFAAIANGTINSGIGKIPNSLDHAPASLGLGITKSLFKVHLPLLRPSILVAWLLVFVEAMKELPAVLLLRPFNFETLSTYVYQLISDEQLEQGAIGAVFIVLFGLLPIIWLNASSQNKPSSDQAVQVKETP